MKAFRFLSRRYRNRRVGEFLKELEMTEGRGTGIPRMLQEAQRNGSPAPIFHTDEERTFLTVEFPIHPLFQDDQEVRVTPKVTENQTAIGLGEKLGERLGEKLGVRLGANEIRIAELLAEDGTLTIARMAQVLKISTTAVEKNISKLQEKGVLKRVGPDKGGHWEVVGA
jgi:ATP-dependent DNA helicase RecG